MSTNILGTLGSSSGLDTQQLVTDLVAAQKAPQQARIDSRSAEFTSQLSAYGLLKSGLSEFQGVLTPLSDPNLFAAKAINVPTTDVVTFNSLTAAAPAGSYQLEVTQIATAQSLAINSSETSADSALGKTETLTFQTGTWTYASGNPSSFAVNGEVATFEVAITADDTLNSIAEKINDTEGTVTASVINISGTFQLLVNANSGVDNALEITSDLVADSDFDFNAASFANVTETQQGQDSAFTFNGLPITRSSNDISDVIDGLNFTLNKADIGSPISFSISEDKSTSETAIRAFIEAYNTLQDTLKPLVGIREDEDNNLVPGDLSRDGTAKNLAARIKETVSSSVLGLTSTDSFSSLASIGIFTDKFGKLEIHEDDFSKAFSENFSKMAGLFGTKTSTSNNNITLNTGSFAAQATAGKYTVDITQAPAKGTIQSTDNLVATDNSDGLAQFTITVNGTSSNNLTLTGNHSTLAELATEMQNVINADSLLAATNIKVDVTIDANDALVITSREYGASSQVSFSAVSTEFDTRVGINTSTVDSNGQDVQGTIDGEAAFGSSNVLLPSLTSPAYGLNFSVKENTVLGVYTASFTRGLAGDLALLTSTALADEGQIANKEEIIGEQKKRLDDDQERLDRKMTTYQQRLSRQYIAMERIIASLNQTSSQLDGLIDRLPFTAKN
ncbi:MAG: flagellar filament capping protein FliD [Pseudomonadales bacterium]|nr:flagellar filament capping protein FliD [Pseudomonadales bacterium]NRA17340.1 flagellar filament capping protein FliD [Oceanospirillaceae bacterium]